MAKAKIEICECCGQKIRQARIIKVDKGMVAALGIAFKFCRDKGIHEFKMRDIREMLSHTQYCTFNNWIRISSGMVYSAGIRVYGLNMERIEKFFKGEWTVHDVTIDPITREQKNGVEMKITEVKGVLEFLDENDVYQVDYVKRPI